MPFGAACLFPLDLDLVLVLLGEKMMAYTDDTPLAKRKIEPNCFLLCRFLSEILRLTAFCCVAFPRTFVMFNTEGGAPHVLLPSLNLASFMLDMSSLNDYDDDEDEIDDNESDDNESDESENNEVGLVNVRRHI